MRVRVSMRVRVRQASDEECEVRKLTLIKTEKLANLETTTINFVFHPIGNCLIVLAYRISVHKTEDLHLLLYSNHIDVTDERSTSELTYDSGASMENNGLGRNLQT